MKKSKWFIVIIVSTILLSGGAILGIYISQSLADTPEFSLPIHNIGDVTGVQVFHDNRSTQLHIGFDFKLEIDSEIFAPVSGKVTQIKKHQMSNGYWIIDVNIRVNSKWSMFIAFEPWTQEESVIDDQMEFITAETGQTIPVNHSLGFLKPVIGSEFPHIHWTIYEHNLFQQTPVSPYDYCNPIAQDIIMDLCLSFGKLPEDS